MSAEDIRTDLTRALLLPPEDTGGGAPSTTPCAGEALQAALNDAVAQAVDAGAHGAAVLRAAESWED